MIKQIIRNFFVFLFLFLLIPIGHGRGNEGPGILSNISAAPETISLEPDLDILPGLVTGDKKIKAGLLYDANQNKIVWEKELQSSYPIASLSKLMTVLLVMEDIQAGKTSWDSLVEATPEAAMVGSSKIWMKKGQVFKVEDLMKSAMICSANDACFLLGQYCAGSEVAFVDRMNEKAKFLGMNNTFFSNPTGLPAPRHEIDNYSSPNDLLILAKEVLKFPDILRIAGMNQEIIFAEKQRFELRNHNKLALEYPEVDGLKTGYTRKAGFCIVATAHKENTRLISIVLGANSPAERNQFVAGMFNSYYQDVLCAGEMEKFMPSKIHPKSNVTAPARSYKKKSHHSFPAKK